MVMVLPLPPDPTSKRPLLVKVEEVPVTSTLLSEESGPVPMKPPRWQPARRWK